MTKDAKRLKDALSQLTIEYIREGNLRLAMRLTLVSNTLEANPALLDRLAKIIKRSM